MRIAMVPALLVLGGVTAAANTVPDPVPPVHATLKELHLRTPLVAAGAPAVTIVTSATGAYDVPARALQQTIRDLTGVTIPIVADSDPAAAVPLPGHVITLGNRSTNKTIGELYDRFYALVDLKYPGPAGYVVRTVHSPLGDGRNAILVGGSDIAGVNRATTVFAERVEAVAKEIRSGAPGPIANLSLGWIMDIELGKGIEAPSEADDVKIWEESRHYGSSGYFGWNIISKRMALYYMTGDEAHAREFLRLAFPDKAAIEELEKLDGERIENKLDPLAGPYHYSAHMMIQFWDLIEESPLFTDEQRLRITNAFSRQLTHRARERVYGRTTPAAFVGGRHADWSAMSLYSLARYFQKDYPDPIWECALTSVKMHFSALEQSAWMAGNNDHLFWFTSYYDPLLNYMVMSGDRPGVANKNLANALRTQDVLFTGTDNDWGVRASSLNFLHRAAHLTGDGRFLFYAQRTGIDTNVFRLGQSYWPDQNLEPRPPTELLNTWTVQEMPEPMWKSRRSGLPLEDSFLWGSVRSALDTAGDYILIKGHNGGGRNPYHTFALLELRLNGTTLLKGYNTQVLTSADGMVEPEVAMDSALRRYGVVGHTAFCVGEVPKMPYCNWRRTLVQRTGRYAVIADQLDFRADSDTMTVVTEWNTVGGTWDAKNNLMRLKAGAGTQVPPGWQRVSAIGAQCSCGPGTPEDLLSTLNSLDIMLLKAKAPGTWIEMPFELTADFAGEIYVDLLNFKDRGKLRFVLDGRPVGDEFDHYAPAVMDARASLGQHTLARGMHRLRVEVVGQNQASTRMYLGLKGITLRPEGSPELDKPSMFELHPSRITECTRSRNMEWVGKATAGQTRRTFYAIVQTPAEQTSQPACVQIADSAAVLALPEPGVIVAGEFEHTQASLAVLATTHLFGCGLRTAGIDRPLVTATAPVDLDWDFGPGTLMVHTDEQVRLTLQIANPAGVLVDGKRAQFADAGDGLQAIELAPGRHALTEARLPEQVRAQFATTLAARLEQGRTLRQQEDDAEADSPPPLPELPTYAAARIEAAPVHSVVASAAQGDVVCVAAGQTIHILGADGQELRRLQTDGPIRVLQWWNEHKLLLAGCTDEKVIAFDLEGNRKWTFVSEMDRAVWEAAKQYWFKSAHPGIYGLHTDVFIDGKSQCFIGSACTLEIVDEHGKLVKRMPVFWGPGWQFKVIDHPDGSRDLLIARQPTDTHALTVVNSRTLRISGRRCAAVPRGHTNVGGWATMSSSHIHYQDLSGDGTEELLTVVNGIWNRVTVWSRDGNALYNAQFGPGERIPARNIRDLDVTDLNGNGASEILVATSTGLVVALNHRCEKLWSRRLSSPPSVLKCVLPQGGDSPRIVVGCDDGTVLVLDPNGHPVHTAKLDARAATINVLRTAQGPTVFLTSAKGEVRGFAVP